ncbi:MULTISPECIES: NO-inducible flavohemoprotein [Bacillus]|uniref:Flavohemoprotein n=1 Tax=Bacillus glycinifermentans TaxID=1664069 RepID=A0AAJ3Z2J0_9BACI|nr:MULTISPECIES: NO-inducible flavohemoprotein [Bacillus]KKB72235.1 dihydropteridine reductase [Bacillus sp. TH008]MDU0073717.1 NO-inducible flavohemoprotein [Bacillus sp. IG6]MED8021602.1 NO-inducible flavohemoprotein [Bacillus glycinifermentans]QAT66652.1 NO-inducible flavohemoprotein [Bacillus glycinifermentans]WKB76405.1 NO-inducible flavohemoprotein [Bacillus glycinifermentans]
MLDKETIQIVKSTAPILKEHSQEIGKRFYELLFSKVPELHNMFNQTNQKRGIQQEALAYAVYAAGENIDHLEALEPVIKRITEKHRAIGVKPEQYPIVGETLLAAVKDVLGDAATEEVLEAWKKAYGEIAKAFINIEQKLYQETEQLPGGWEGYREFRVDQKVKESSLITSFYLKPEDGKPIASYEAGQYLTIKAEIEGEAYTHIRHYSLSDAPGKEYYRISVKREDAHGDAPAGIVSTYLHQQVQTGDILTFSAPAGDFVISSTDLPLVLISGGVGITPLLSMLNTTAEQQPNRQVTFIHSAKNSEFHAFKKHVADLAEKNENIRSFVCYEAPSSEDRYLQNFDKEGFIDLEWLQSILPGRDADFYFCGPIPFMKAVNGALKEWGVPKNNIHYEVFNPVAILEEE